VLSDELTFNERIVNMVCLVGTASLLLSAVTRALLGATLTVNILTFTFCFVGAFFIYLTNRYHLYKVTLWILIVVICDILLPTLFFFIGGADSGIAAFVVMSSTCIFLLLEGKPRIIMLAIHLALMAGCFVLAAYHPELVVPLDPRKPLLQALDNIQCFVVSIVFVGLAIVFQRHMYSQERRKVERAKAELESEQQVSSAFFNSNPHINVLFDDKLRPINFNPTALSFAGSIGSEEELRHNLSPLLAKVIPEVQPNGRPSADVETWLRRTLKEGEVSFETTFILRGVEHNISVMMKRIPYADSVAVVAYLVDNSEFYRMRREALLSARAKSEFLANMSHEIRTPLNAVISMNSIGRAAADVERKDYAFDQIGTAADHLLGIINDILDMSKIEANKLELDKKAFNVEDVLRRVANVISFKTSEKHQQFTFDIDDSMPVGIVSDDLRLTQVITNLLSNAVKFTPEHGSIEVSARALEQKGSRCTLEFSVRDTGIGIPEENLERIFHSFEQVESSTARKFGGTGLGLTISAKFVELMGGAFTVVSEPGKGSTFSFTVKVEQTESVPGIPLDPTIDPAKLRCLVVGSEDASLESCGRIVRGVGTPCDLACGREQVQRLLAQGRYDLCLVNWRTGSEKEGGCADLVRHLKENNLVDHVVIAIYPFELAEAEGQHTIDTRDCYLTKPLFRSDYVALLNDLYGESPSKGQAEPLEEEQDFSGVRILLAEDMDVNKEIVCALFEPLGFEIDWAKNGLEAVEMFAGDPSSYDLILMDMQMPEMDGLEATRQIRSLSDYRARKVPIIALTANVFKEDIDNSLAAGMNDHIGKPLDFDEALGKIARHLKS
jgi:signal transduction histidine kinase